MANKVEIDESLCTVCGLCELQCPDLCIVKNEKTKKMEIEQELCVSCGFCILTCPKKAMKLVTARK